MLKVLVICGPTCTGKTSLSIKLAHLYNGEIINGDSMQVYKHMDIGTAKIKENEKDGVIHHLFDFKELNESYSVAEYQKLVRDKIIEISNKNKLPIIVGGTGLYLKAALYDYEFKEEETKDYGLEDKSSEELYDLLIKLDPKTSLTIHPNNRKRIIRALQIYYENKGKGKSDINSSQNHKPIYDVLFIGLSMERIKLYKLIDDRVDQMIDEGLVDEASYVYKNSLENTTCRQAIGYKELFDYFNNLDSLENCIQKIKFSTHRFVKRQYTWFNHQMDVKWIDVTNKDKEETIKDAALLVNKYLYGK